MRSTGLFLLAFSFWGATSTARWMNADEADASIENKVVHIHVRADGSSTYEASTRVKVLNETGRIDWGTLRLSYSPKNSKLEVIKALAITNGTVFKVDRHDIVDTQIYATESGFDESRQVVISFPQVQVGSELTLETKQSQFRPYLEKRFFDRFSFGDYELQQAGETDIEAEVPLYFQINDPQNHLAVTKAEAKGHYRYTIKLKAPLVQRVVEEPRSVLPDEKLTWVAVSSAPDFATMFGPLSDRYEEVLKAPLPQKFVPLREAARAKKDDIAKVNLVLSSLADLIRYMGDWRSVDGAWVPRSLEQISDTRFGDCKDFSTITVKILRDLGMESHVALTYRGLPAHDVPQVAAPNFNHAIVSVRVNGKQLWVDPTNFQSFADGVFEDIAGRHALVLQPGKIELRPIEFTPAGNNEEEAVIHTRLAPGRMRTDRLELRMTGSVALAVTGQELRYSKEQIEGGTVANAANMAEVVTYKFNPFDLKSRIVKPIQLGLEIERHFNPIQTSLGPALDFSPPEELRELLRIERGKRESDVKLTVPFVTSTTVYLENVSPQGKLNDCRVHSPWIDYNFTTSSHPAKVIRRMEVKSYLIPVEQVKSKDFADLQAQLLTCGQARYLVFRTKKDQLAKRTN